MIQLGKNLLGHPSVKKFSWIVQSKQIIGCPVTVQDIDIYHAIWGNTIASLKGNTIRKKPIQMETIPCEFSQETHQASQICIYDSRYNMCKLNMIFILTNHKIIFTKVDHLTHKKSKTIFKALKGVYIYYIKSGFQILTLHVDGEYVPFRLLIHWMRGVMRVNLVSANKNFLILREKYEWQSKL